MSNPTEQELDAAVFKSRLDNMIAGLKKMAASTIGCDKDDFMVDDYAGGNIDDAYDMGTRHGAVELARELLDQLGVGYE